jgi:hypothetical protein
MPLKSLELLARTPISLRYNYNYKRVPTEAEVLSLNLEILRLYLNGSIYGVLVKKFKVKHDVCLFRCNKVAKALFEYNQKSPRAIEMVYKSHESLKPQAEFWINELELYALANGIKAHDYSAQ